MLIKIETQSGKPISRQIYDQIRLQILTGQMKPGQQITSVRDLAAEIKVNPMTVSKVYSTLESEDFLEHRRGIGLFVKELNRKNSDSICKGILEDLIKNTVLESIQLGVSEEQIVQLLRDYYRKFKIK